MPLLLKEKKFGVTSSGVRLVNLIAEEFEWEYKKGKKMKVWGYNRTIPGPEIRVKEGQRVKINITNKLPEGTSIHWHGLNVPNKQDGVPGVTQSEIKPGTTYTYEFIAKPAGTHMYHTHGGNTGGAAMQMDMGLYGAFIVEPVSYTKRADFEYTIMLDEWNVGGLEEGKYDLFTMNGKAFPATKTINLKIGQRLRLRIINAGTMAIHPMHLHGMQFKVVAADGNEIPTALQMKRNTIVVNPGEIYDIEFTVSTLGKWLFHCHDVHHADKGMIMIINVKA